MTTEARAREAKASKMECLAQPLDLAVGRGFCGNYKLSAARSRLEPGLKVHFGAQEEHRLLEKQVQAAWGNRSSWWSMKHVS